jgi:hypothetical protein
MRTIRGSCWIWCLLAGACAPERVTRSPDARSPFLTVVTGGGVRFRARASAPLPEASFRVRFTLSAERRPVPASICLPDGGADSAAAAAVVRGLAQVRFPDFPPGEHVVTAVATPAVIAGTDGSVRWLVGFREARRIGVDFRPADRPAPALAGSPRRC